MVFDVLAIGDTTIDAFIRLKDARVTCDVNEENCMLGMRFGDKIPYEFVEIVPAVGNAANAAVAVAKLGLNVTARLHVGADENGKVCIETLKKAGVDTSLMVTESGKKTNYHYVLWYESERTILLKHEIFSYSFPKLTEAPKWIYLSSVGEGTESYHDEIATYVEANSGVKLAFQPGTFQMNMGRERLKLLYARSDIFFCNKEEAERILNVKENDAQKLLGGVLALGVKIAVITDGRKGLYADDGVRAFHIPMYPDMAPPQERTGAGDATASTTVAELAQGKTLEEALKWGLVNSMHVVQEIGAQKGLLSSQEIADWLSKAPADFKATPLS